MNLSENLLSVPGFGPSTFLKFKKAEIETLADLLHLYPIRYDDFRLKSAISLLQPGESVTVQGRVINAVNSLTRRQGLTIQKLVITDGYSQLELVWFNQPYILRQFKKNEEYFFSGKIVQFKTKIGMQVNEYEDYSQKQIHTGRLVPYYTKTIGISSRLLRQKIFWLLEELAKTDLGLHRDFPFLQALHFPNNHRELEKAQKELSFAQLLNIKISQIKQQHFLELGKKPILKQAADQEIKAFIKNLPFTPTASQLAAFAELNSDFGSERTKPRLLMGEVGSGKTAVMAYAAFVMAKNEYQTIIMTPTEALAAQHYQNFIHILKDYASNIALLSAKVKPKNIESKKILIGTHALLYTKLNWEMIGLVIIDEQHKFGVLQRELLLKRADYQPRVLLVSATPIPRSLALTLYHHTNLSYLMDKPYKNRVKTFLVPEEKRLASYKWLAEKVKTEKLQVYLVCPAIENKNGKINELRTVKEETERLQKLLPDLRIGSIYSRHPQKEKILNSFRQHNLDLLITTSLIEVGLDIGSASIIIIENAERFGLNQLHQLRGRIGRRGQSGYCLLFSSATDPKIISRLKILEKINDGTKIAVYDLKYRGPGNLLGTLQHGFNYIRSEDLFDAKLMTKIEQTAQKIVANFANKEYTSLLVKKLY